MGDVSDGGGAGSSTSSGVASGEDETSVVVEVAERVAMPVEDLGEVGDEYLLENSFSLARLFWNHTFSLNMMKSDILVSTRRRKGKVTTRVKEMGKKRVKKKRQKKQESAKDDAYLNLPR
jgi:hypothetical protein